MTLAVLMRNWMHSTKKSDHTANTIILTAFLGGAVPKQWAGYVAEHPIPAPRLVLARILVGASKGAESTKKRTPAQAADAIISAFTTHFETLEFPQLENEVKFFLQLIMVCAEEHRPFVRAFLKSGKFWAAVASVLRRSKQVPQGSRQGMLAYLVLQIYVNGWETMEKEGREYIDTTIYNWISGGLLGALDDIVDLLTSSPLANNVGSPASAVVLTNIVSVIMTHIELESLSARTLAALRAELPRPRIVKRMIVAGSTLTGDRESEARNRETMRGMKDMLGGRFPDENNGAWLQGVWQLLQSIAFAVQDEGACARRGCDRRADKGAGTTCKMCKVTVDTSYCSKVPSPTFVPLSFPHPTSTTVLAGLIHMDPAVMQKLLAEETERRTRWKVLISTDPRRTVRVLTAAGWAPETIDGDTSWDVPSILRCLETPSKNPQSAVWRRLVKAGLFTAL
ncbi:hypothetical protein TRAPUB_12959 [Trametes pubescens]|uniref:Uncharacterized protein n=1 Tax=Trametes pubescens TaxID=154538 RepID=A0A1M2VSE2_TRAPU|nr:hypothetical protein TRAPUB_12959 [Trametes pubescens]